MKNFEELLLKLENYLNEIEAPILNYLQEGTELFVEDSVLEQLPIEVKLLYRWRNGTKLTEDTSLGKLWLFNFGVFLPIEQALTYYKEGINNLTKWDEGMFPLFASGGGEFYLIDCNKSSVNYGMIFHHSIGNIDFDIIITMYDSLNTFVNTIYQCYKEKAYYFSNIGGIEFDVEKEKLISSALNPNSEYWKIY